MEDRAYALRVCMVVWVEAVKIAEKVDVPNAAVDKALKHVLSVRRRHLPPGCW